MKNINCKQDKISIRSLNLIVGVFLCNALCVNASSHEHPKQHVNDMSQQITLDADRARVQEAYILLESALSANVVPIDELSSADKQQLKRMFPDTFILFRIVGNAITLDKMKQIDEIYSEYRLTKELESKDGFGLYYSQAFAMNVMMTWLCQEVMSSIRNNALPVNQLEGGNKSAYERLHKAINTALRKVVAWRIH